MNLHLILAALIGSVFAAPAGATICKYVDSDGNIFYSNGPQRNDVKLIACDVLEEPTAKSTSGSASKAAAARGRLAAEKWVAMVEKIKIGMTDVQLRAIPGLWSKLNRRRVMETAAGTDTWYYFDEDLAVKLHNGRVDAIFR
jgi:hypothetical protein